MGHEYHSVCPLVRIGPPPPSPRPQATVSWPPLLESKDGDTLAACEGVGGPNSDDWIKSLALSPIISVDSYRELQCDLIFHGFTNPT